MLYYYMYQATVIKLDPNNAKVTVLRLMRMKINNFNDFRIFKNKYGAFERY